MEITKEKRAWENYGMLGELQNRHMAEWEQVTALRKDMSTEAKIKKQLQAGFRHRETEAKLQAFYTVLDAMKSQQTVVTADMISKDTYKMCKKNYGISEKELKRLVSDAQDGLVPELEYNTTMKKDSVLDTHRKFTTQSIKRVDEQSSEDGFQRTEWVNKVSLHERASKLEGNLVTKGSYETKKKAQKKNGGAVTELTELLKKMRKEKNVTVTQAVQLDAAQIAEYRAKLGMSEKDLKKLSLELQSEIAPTIQAEIQAEKKQTVTQKVEEQPALTEQANEMTVEEREQEEQQPQAELSPQESFYQIKLLINRKELKEVERIKQKSRRAHKEQVEDAGEKTIKDVEEELKQLKSDYLGMVPEEEQAKFDVREGELNSVVFDLKRQQAIYEKKVYGKCSLMKDLSIEELKLINASAKAAETVQRAEAKKLSMVNKAKENPDTFEKSISGQITKSAKSVLKLYDKPEFREKTSSRDTGGQDAANVEEKAQAVLASAAEVLDKQVRELKERERTLTEATGRENELQEVREKLLQTEGKKKEVSDAAWKLTGLMNQRTIWRQETEKIAGGKKEIKVLEKKINDYVAGMKEGQKKDILGMWTSAERNLSRYRREGVHTEDVEKLVECVPRHSAEKKELERVRDEYRKKVLSRSKICENRSEEEKQALENAIKEKIREKIRKESERDAEIFAVNMRYITEELASVRQKKTEMLEAYDRKLEQNPSLAEEIAANKRELEAYALEAEVSIFERMEVQEVKCFKVYEADENAEETHREKELTAQWIYEQKKWAMKQIEPDLKILNEMIDNLSEQEKKEEDQDQKNLLNQVASQHKADRSKLIRKAVGDVTLEAAENNLSALHFENGLNLVRQMYADYLSEVKRFYREHPTAELQKEAVKRRAVMPPSERGRAKMNNPEQYRNEMEQRYRTRLGNQ